MENNNTYRTYAAAVINTYSEAVRIYASASIEHHMMDETFSELAYRNARTVAHFARLAFGMSINSYFCTVCGRNLYTWKHEDEVCVFCLKALSEAHLVGDHDRNAHLECPDCTAEAFAAIDGTL